MTRLGLKRISNGAKSAVFGPMWLALRSVGRVDSVEPGGFGGGEIFVGTGSREVRGRGGKANGGKENGEMFRYFMICNGWFPTEGQLRIVVVLCDDFSRIFPGSGYDETGGTFA